MNIDMDNNIFKEEAFELLEKIEEALMEISSSKEKTEIINNIFRYLHTIKGSGSMFGLDKVASFAHEFESFFDNIRKGKISFAEEMITLSLKAKDYIRLILERDELEQDLIVRKEILDELRKITGNIKVKEKNEIESAVHASSENESEIFKITFKPSEEILMRGITILPIFEELRTLGETKIIGFTDRIPDFDELDCERCHLHWIIFVVTDKGEAAVKNAFIFAEYYSAVKITRIKNAGELADLKYKKIGDILVENEFISREEAEKINNEQKLFGQIALERGIIDENTIESALEEQKLVKNIITEQKEKTENSTIRVKNEKLDELLNLAGEFVTMQARLTAESGKHNDYELSLIAENFSRLTSELRDISMKLRMIPFSVTFNNFKRLIHDLSTNLGKKIYLEVSGGETEVDKNIIDHLKDPLMHIIRNSCDHGIEDEETRLKYGKPQHGTISLSAGQSGSNVVITVKDDGTGLDIEKIRKKAIEQHHLDNNECDEKKIINTIFLPGFSTAEKTTGVSGRGVGMDIVRKNIEYLKGNIEIESVSGKGTTFVISIPLTLAIIEGLLIEIGDRFYIINLSDVKECTDMFGNITKNENTGDFIKLRDEIIPYIRLKDLFELETSDTMYETMVIVEHDRVKTGLVVDRVVGKFQAVIKPISRVFKKYDFISGASIIGDGTVALILDIKKISAQKKRNLSARA
jgi:two-component system, chemotaxis family, sensor kinase CheA